MEYKTIEEHTTDMAEWQRSDEHEDEATLGLEMISDPSMNSPTADLLVTSEESVSKSSYQNKDSTKSELISPSELDTTTDYNADSVSTSDRTSIIQDDDVVLPAQEFHQEYTVAKWKTNLTEESDETGAMKCQNISPVQECQDTANHDLDQASTSADHEKKAALGPVEISGTTDLQMDPMESPKDEKVGNKLNLVDCPDEVLQQIFGYVLVSDNPIRPYWNFGSLEVAAETACKENFATVIVAFTGNKKLIDQATTVLYGDNSFKLRHAKLSLWWLKRIGSNVSKLRHMAIRPEEGVMDAFGIRVSIFRVQSPSFDANLEY